MNFFKKSIFSLILTMLFLIFPSGVDIITNLFLAIGKSDKIEQSYTIEEEFIKKRKINNISPYNNVCGRVLLKGNKTWVFIHKVKDETFIYMIPQEYIFLNQGDKQNVCEKTKNT